MAPRTPSASSGFRGQRVPGTVYLPPPQLDRWYRLMKGATLGSFVEVRSLFPDADHIGEYYVFNIGGNQLRLIATPHLNRRKCYIREILTHAEYDRWKP